jgi:hypothetical protein
VKTGAALVLGRYGIGSFVGSECVHRVDVDRSEQRSRHRLDPLVINDS